MSEIIPPMVSTTPPPLGDDEEEDEDDFTPTHFNYQIDTNEDSDSPEPKATDWPPIDEPPPVCQINGVHDAGTDEEEELKPPGVLDSTSQDSTNTDSGLCSASEEVSPLPPQTSPPPPVEKPEELSDNKQHPEFPPNGLSAFSSKIDSVLSQKSKEEEKEALEEINSQNNLDKCITPPPICSSDVPKINNQPVLPQLNCDSSFEFGDFENGFDRPVLSMEAALDLNSDDDFADFQAGDCTKNLKLDENKTIDTSDLKTTNNNNFKSEFNDFKSEIVEDFNNEFKSESENVEFTEFTSEIDKTEFSKIENNDNSPADLDFDDFKIDNTNNGDFKIENTDTENFKIENTDTENFKIENTDTENFKIENTNTVDDFDFDDFKSGNDFSDFQSDDFADFSSAPAASSDQQDWSAAFPEPSLPPPQDSDDDFDDFESAVPTNDLPSQNPDVAGVFSKLFSSSDSEMSLPEIPPEALTSWLSSGKLWSSVHQVQTCPALDFQWGASSSNTWLLRALGIDSRNILFGQKWNSNMPRFAANLGSSPLEPMKAASGSSSASNEEMVVPVPAAQFDWTGSGLVNPLDSVRKQQQLQRNSEQERLQRVQAVISSLPNLSFMRSSQLINKKSS